ncbi:hypothetical protein H257_05009 [Aphanomyces astaci]|uniref:Uncharacterized protein n=1 Tax=Aphanomyces astaci TaxID=112090 RepID=W4GRJ4_APHAT|nr:hypothetical protein H257_05009 [Aphanomyces astaci]ETV82350.1 hypothetical protein H257_05009 [Aphanomyces astaci]|eukprot:XP_009828019.1 hypothetical protein H257_05009 [Aphanomyces astaci]
MPSVMQQHTPVYHPEDTTDWNTKSPAPALLEARPPSWIDRLRKVTLQARRRMGLQALALIFLIIGMALLLRRRQQAVAPTTAPPGIDIPSTIPLKG